MSKEEKKAVEQTAKQKAKKSSAKKPNVFVRFGRKMKEVFSELKKVSWPTFGKVVKSTVVVLSVTAVFLLVVFGIDQLLYFLYGLLTKNM